MSFFDWFWAAVAGFLGWMAAPFLLALGVAFLIMVFLIGYMIYLWFVDFCKTAKEFYGSIFK